MSDDESENHEFTHTTDSGDIQMVDVGDKPGTARRAVAEGTLTLQPTTVDAVRTDAIEKGDVLATIRIGAVQAVKHTWETIPMCHQIPITNVDTTIDVADDHLTLTVAVETIGQTGCEMEALQGVTTGLATAWDMVKATEKTDADTYPATAITNVTVTEKTKRELD